MDSFASESLCSAALHYWNTFSRKIFKKILLYTRKLHSAVKFIFERKPTELDSSQINR